MGPEVSVLRFMSCFLWDTASGGAALREFSATLWESINY
jgi:hypothetical protein